MSGLLTPADMGGLWAFVPACATPDAADWRASDTVDADALADLVGRLVSEGVDGIVTTGSAGESHTLTPSEHELVMQTAVEAAAGRAPVFIGVSTLNTRESIAKARLAASIGAEGIMSGTPMYLPQTPDNAIRYYEDLSEAVPDLAIMIYHNVHAFRITITPPMFGRLGKLRNVVAVKQTSMDILNLLGTIHAVGNDMAVLVLDQLQYPAMMFGAAGAWSTDAAMGPWPSLALRDACQKKDWDAAARIAGDMQTPFAHLGLTMDEFQAMQSAWWKLAIDASGYAKAGPARPPFVQIPERVVESGERYGKEWRALADRYRPTQEEGT